jgi:hypothetical protein
MRQLPLVALLLLLPVTSRASKGSEEHVVSINLGSGWNAPQALLGPELELRPLPWLGIAMTLGIGGMSMWHPDAPFFILSGDNRTERTLHGPIGQRVGATVILEPVVGDVLHLGFRVGVQYNPGASDLQYSHGLFEGQTVTASVFAMLASAELALHWQDGFWRFEVGYSHIVSESLPSPNRGPYGEGYVDRFRFADPQGFLVSTSVGLWIF